MKNIAAFIWNGIMSRLVLLLGFSAAAQGWGAPYTASITSLRPDTNSPGWWRLSASVPSNSVVALEMARALPARTWSPLSPPVFAPPSGVVTFAIPGEPDGAQAFFRVKAEPFEIKIDDDSRQITLETSRPVPLGALLDALKLGNDVGVFLADEADPFSLVQPVNPETRLRLPVPVLPADTSLAGLTVEFYSVTRNLAGVTLTPAEFLRRTASFRLLGTVTGGQINALLGVPPVVWGGGLPAPTITPVHLSGSKAKKYNIGIVAEGYANTGADQTAFRGPRRHRRPYRWRFPQ